MEKDILDKLEQQNQKIDAIYGSVEKTRKYFMWTLIISVAFIVLPLIGLAFAVPQLISVYSTMGAGL